MAIKTLVLRNNLDKANATLAELCAREEECRNAIASFTTREEELLKDIEAVTNDEEREAVDAEVNKLADEEKAKDDELAEITAEKTKVEETIRQIESELAEEENAEPSPEPSADPTPENDNGEETEKEQRKEKRTMETRKAFFGMTRDEAKEFVQRDEVHAFLERVKESGMNKRAISGGDALIPTDILDLLRENINEYSKLLKHTRYVRVGGKARQVINGAIPEAVWTEMCGTLNELAISFANVEVDGYKVGGVICVCNQLMHDSDIDLAREIIEQLGASIGKALDKAIIFGTGTKMPVGFFTRLAQTSEPSGYSGRPWVDLHTSNILKTNNTGATMFSDIVTFSGAMKGSYSPTGNKFWAMNNATYTYLVAQALNVNSGYIVSGVGKEMPVVGGAIEILDFIPDNMIFAGYDGLFLLAERDGAFIGYSEDVKWIEDQTVFKGRSVYDGVAVIAEGFVAIGVKNTTPVATNITFAPDTANP